MNVSNVRNMVSAVETGAVDAPVAQGETPGGCPGDPNRRWTADAKAPRGAAAPGALVQAEAVVELTGRDEAEPKARECQVGSDDLINPLHSGLLGLLR